MQFTETIGAPARVLAACRESLSSNARNLDALQLAACAQRLRGDAARAEAEIVADIANASAEQASGIEQVLLAAKERKIPIRIGVNSGSLEEDILERHGYPTPEALFESAMRHVGICEEFGFRDIIISVKSTDVKLMIEAYRLVAERTDIPLHLGVTEAGTTRIGTIKSAVGIGTLVTLMILWWFY